MPNDEEPPSALHNPGSGCGRLGLEQHMKMLGHQNPAEEQEIPFPPHLLQPLNRAAPKAIGKEKAVRR